MPNKGLSADLRRRQTLYKRRCLKSALHNVPASIEASLPEAERLRVAPAVLILRCSATRSLEGRT
jgi:hypothetical protein